MPKRDYYVFVCINERPEDSPRGSCAGRGSVEIIEHLRGLLRERGLRDKVRVLQSSCLECCASGVTMAVYPHDVWYCQVTREFAEQVLNRMAADEPLPDTQRMPAAGFE